MDRTHIDHPAATQSHQSVNARHHGLTRELAPDVVRLEPGPVVAALCEAFQLTERELRGMSKKRRFTEPRAVGYWLLLRHSRLPLVDIARVFGRTDHVTVLSGVKTCETLRGKDRAFQQRTDQLERDLEAKAKGTAAA
jgi:chromosomal replication initiator protein